MKIRALTKGEKQNWRPLRNVTPVKISAKNIEGNKVVVSKSTSDRILIS